MFPQPLHFIGIDFVRSYGIMLAIAFLIGILWARKRAVKAGLSPDLVIDLSFIVLIASRLHRRYAIPWEQTSIALCDIPHECVITVRKVLAGTTEPRPSDDVTPWC